MKKVNTLDLSAVDDRVLQTENSTLINNAS